MERTGLEAPSAFAVEDSLVGATAASRAGLGVVLIPDSSFVRNYSVEEKEKLNLLAEGKDLRTVIEILDKNRKINIEKIIWISCLTFQFSSCRLISTIKY